MTPSYSTKVIFLSSNEQITKLIRLGQETADPTALVQHQLDAPLDFDLSTVKLDETRQKKASDSLIQANDSRIKTFRDLFTNPELPPQLLGLMKLSKNYFKQRIASEPEGSPAREVFYLFYLLSIAVARIRWDINISKLTDQQQLQAIRSIMGQPWIDGQIRELLAEAREVLRSMPSASRWPKTGI
jgi:hypothetical protein